MIKANDPNLSSWIFYSKESDFPIQNIPFGVFCLKDQHPRIGSRIGDKVIDLGALFRFGYLNDLNLKESDLNSDSLNNLMKHGKHTVHLLRERISSIFDINNPELKENSAHHLEVFFDESQVNMLLPVQIGDYTDFYSSKEHAANVGIMFRDPANALLPNWLWIPVGYHGRASSVVVSGTDFHRPKGQIKPNDNEDPIFGASRQVDFELEMGFITYDGVPLGDSIPVEEAENYIFGMCLFNDWSARDIQKWEYVPLGPFLGKNFASSMSAWIVTMEALQPFKVDGPAQDPKVLSYLQYKESSSYDISLQVAIATEKGEETVVSNSNFKYMYWNMAQQLAHHTVNGCNVRRGDLMGSGTISGPTPDSYGSMLELAWKGTKPILMHDGSERRFILDNDTVIMRGYCQNEKYRIGFGQVVGKVLPAK